SVTPQTAGLPAPRATTAACEASPPAVVTTAADATSAGTSPGVVSVEKRTAGTPPAASSRARCALSAISPEAAPGEAGKPLAGAGGRLAAYPAVEGAVRRKRAGLGVAAARGAVTGPLPGADVQRLHVQGEAQVVGQLLRAPGAPAAGGVPALQQCPGGQGQL